MAHAERSEQARTGRRALIGDADPFVRSALRLVLTQASARAAIGEANDAHDLLADAAATIPDLVLLDWDLPGLRPEVVLAALHARAPAAAVVVISTRPEPRPVALAAGAAAFACKSDDPSLLLATLRRLDWPLQQVHNPPSA